MQYQYVLILILACLISSTIAVQCLDDYPIQTHCNSSYQCKMCKNDTCKKCAEDLDTCLECKTGYLFEGKCYDNIIEDKGAYCDPSTKICQKCKPNTYCSKCDSSLESCLSCYNDQYFYKNTCSDKQPEGAYCDSKKSCEECSLNPECKSCEQDKKTCLECKNDYLMDKECKKSQPDQSYCDSKRICTKCDNEKCQSCDSDKKTCTQCKKGFLYQKECQDNINFEGKYCDEKEKKCYDCQDKNCSKCDQSQNKCNLCKEGFTLDASKSGCIQKEFIVYPSKFTPEKVEEVVKLSESTSEVAKVSTVVISSSLECCIPIKFWYINYRTEQLKTFIHNISRKQFTLINLFSIKSNIKQFNLYFENIFYLYILDYPQYLSSILYFFKHEIYIIYQMLIYLLFQLFIYNFFYSTAQIPSQQMKALNLFPFMYESDSNSSKKYYNGKFESIKLEYDIFQSCGQRVTIFLICSVLTAIFYVGIEKNNNQKVVSYSQTLYNKLFCGFIVQYYQLLVSMFSIGINSQILEFSVQSDIELLPLKIIMMLVLIGLIVLILQRLYHYLNFQIDNNEITREKIQNETIFESKIRRNFMLIYVFIESIIVPTIFIQFNFSYMTASILIILLQTSFIILVIYLMPFLSKMTNAFFIIDSSLWLTFYIQYLILNIYSAKDNVDDYATILDNTSWGLIITLNLILLANPVYLIINCVILKLIQIIKEKYFDKKQQQSECLLQSQTAQEMSRDIFATPSKQQHQFRDRYSVSTASFVKTRASQQWFNKFNKSQNIKQDSN